jgi:hypothetical protein
MHDGRVIVIVQTGVTVTAFLVCQCARELTRFGGLLVVRQFRDEHNGTLSWAHGFRNEYAGLLNHDPPKLIQVGERFASLGGNGNHEGAAMLRIFGRQRTFDPKVKPVI